MTKKGYTMLELLLTLMIISSLFVILLRSFNEPNIDYLLFMNDYLLGQKEALVNREEFILNNDYGKPISFNKDGKVNMGQTLDINNHSIVIHIGSGYATIE